MVRRLCCIFFCFFSTQALAFLLPSKFILKKTTENNGKGGYFIEQTVNLRFPSGAITLQEVINLESENLITIQTRSQVDSPIKLDFVIRYQNSKRDNGLTVRTLSKEFFEPILFSRNVDFLTKKVEDIFQKPLLEVPVRFSRFDSVVSFAFGKPTPAESKSDLPGLWIEKDSFLIRKIRFSSEAYIEQSDFLSATKGFFIAKNKLIKWNQSEAIVQVSKVHEKNKSTILTKQLQVPTQTKFQIENLDSSDLAKSVKDFYERFR
jgi:hypothetical protein